MQRHEVIVKGIIYIKTKKHSRFTLVHHLCYRYNDEHVGFCHLRWYNLQNNDSAHRLPME